jgi:hypothetical protein
MNHSPELPGDAHISAAALSLLLATHPEVAELPIEWHIDLDRTIRPFMTVRHADCAEAARLIAAALELDIVEGGAFESDGVSTRSLYVEGRWGGAQWSFVAYAAAPAPEGVS